MMATLASNLPLIGHLGPGVGDEVCRQVGLSGPLEAVSRGALSVKECDALANWIGFLAFDELEAVPFVEIAPTVFANSDASIPDDFVPVRVLGGMRRNHVKRWGEFGVLSCADVLKWWSVGRGSARDLLQTLIRAELATPDDIERRPCRASTEPAKTSATSLRFLGRLR